MGSIVGNKYYKIVDLSRHNGEIDMAKMLAQNVHGLILRATVGDYYTDPRFYENWTKAEQAGLKVTAYHVMRPDVTVKEQVHHFMKVVGARKPNFGNVGWVVDNEVSADQKVSTITDTIKGVLGDLSTHAAAPAMNYTRAEWWNRFVKPDPFFVMYPLFVARYSETMAQPWDQSNDPPYVIPHTYNNWEAWQYSADGNWQGAVHGCDSPHVDISRAKVWIFENDQPEPEPIPEVDGFRPFQIKINASILNLRSGPGTTFSDIGNTYQGDVMTVYDVVGDWYQVRSWVHRNYVKKL